MPEPAPAPEAISTDLHAPFPDGASITLARHGRPALSRKVRIDAAGYKVWWDAYDEGGLAPGQHPPPALRHAAASAGMIVASPLARSLETARAVAGARQVATDDIFVEARLPPPPLPALVKLGPRSWGVVSRISWWCGLDGGQESRREAELRAERAADRLEELVRAHGSVLMVGHGWFNRMIRPVLLARGWACADDGGDSYWSHRRYIRPQD
jgi:broad specificity phosphatase PhoE